MTTHETRQSVAIDVPATAADVAATTTGEYTTGDRSPFTLKQLERLDEALTMASRETGINFSVYVGRLSGDSRATAEGLHPGMGAKAANGVLLAVDPGQRLLEIVTGQQSVKRLPDRSCALAALSMTAAFGSGDLVGGIVNGLRMLSDQAGHPSRFR
ncbi:MAG: DUF5130 domain-containing protein [Actinomycetota bacterium]|nr:DUF5130 domain-containing protein [Actinomycetota bacterium]